jgi:two-component system sensor histidine kinase PilS (NtrC family)
MAAFYLVGYLSGFLAEQTKKSRAELKETKLDLDKLEALHGSIINSITSGLIVLDAEERVMLFNPTAEKILGVHSDQVSGLKLASGFPALGEHFQSIVKMRSLANMPPFKDVPYQRPNGIRIYLRLSISPLYYLSKEEGGIILILQDVTEIKRIEENMKRVEELALVGEMAAGIAHEIRNPMASISGSIEMLKEGGTWDSTQNRLMKIVSREVDRLNKLISDFLLFARPKESKYRTFDLNRLIDESLELFKNGQHWNEKITVIKHFKDSLVFESDPDQIRQVLWNLFLNACDAMASGGTLHITTQWESERLASNRKNVSIVIRDTGDGFESTLLPKLFKPFFTTKEGGTGLGLATVKRIIDQLHGSISGHNHSDGGAEILIVLPAGSTEKYDKE